ncbi:FmdB family zinc ribbon protein [Candidatus Viridilinea mediisalina]|uniref:FmdB family transcriptional regulator n=1 Tax=Candidatus Viridilinea mediisalina TaxID=2024553 RepID=A0A2A6RIY1_9CHLR|nr:FmdB family zinc ribbon protein [Candidatus Viridilinea mediisalina]PDW02849.1 FmdB family transcriptional regulator [Candidatus Viridilinea mediisalina]
MPTYVYACDGCGKQFEQFQSFKDDPLTVCPCGESGKVRRVIQPAGIVFKGSGWYINDSRGTGSSTVAGDAAKKDSPAETSSSTTSDPAPKSEGTATPAATTDA